MSRTRRVPHDPGRPEGPSDGSEALPPEPVVTDVASEAEPGQRIEHRKLFVREGPYIVNIPPMVPHSFQNLGEELAELVVIFPTNVWEYDVLDDLPFATPEAKEIAERARSAGPQEGRARNAAGRA